MLDGFEKLEQDYKPLILSIMKSLHIYRDHEHYYQTGLVALWEAHTRYDQAKAKFSTFAFSTIRGRILEQLNEERRFYDHHQGLQPEDSLDLADSNTLVPFVNNWVEIYCGDLTENQRKWVQKRIIEDKRIIDIAREESVSTDAVKSWGKEAIKKMRKTIVL